MSEIIPYEPRPVSIMPVMDVQQAIQRRQQMVAFVQGIMVEGTDYGKVPNTDKNTLLKPGAEKLTTFFGLTPRFVVIKETERWGDDSGEPFFYYWFQCQLYRGDYLVGEGDGSCNSHESKYRWRWVGEEDLPPGIARDTLKKREGTLSEFTFAVDKAETSGKYGKPPEYWQQFKDAIANGTARRFQKATAKGAQYDAWEINATVYRVPNEDIASQANTILKMAQKRALVAATLIAVNASEFFTQDLEDMDPGTFETGTSTTSAPAKPKSKRNGNGRKQPRQAPNPPPASPSPSSDAGKSFKADVIQAIIQAGYAENPANAVHMLSLSEILNDKDEPELVLTWGDHYRSARATGDEPKEAAKYADGKLKGLAEAA